MPKLFACLFLLSLNKKKLFNLPKLFLVLSARFETATERMEKLTVLYSLNLLPISLKMKFHIVASCSCFKLMWMEYNKKLKQQFVKVSCHL